MPNIQDSTEFDIFRRQADRQGSVRFAITLITFFVAIGSLVWGAAKMSSTVEQLSATIVELRSTVSTMSNALVAMQTEQARSDVRVRVLELQNEKK